MVDKNLIISSSVFGETDSFCLKGKRNNLLIVNLSAVVFGLILLYPFAHISHYGLPFIVFSVIAIVLWMAFDYFTGSTGVFRKSLSPIIRFLFSGEKTGFAKSLALTASKM